ncbi:hypothetical protein MNB_SM-5-1401 [hydrothermal vent metagenome]|uniref:STAS domain-containing protein n=1 Tax=hydrothermal vent metagenome TaxID=652676 RepID=A0A1W1CU60_9ZZZZ
MDIKTVGNSVIITGNIKTIGDYQAIKSTLESLAATSKTITIDIKDSISITSSVIGFLTKLVQKEKIDIQIRVGDANLYNLFDEINVVQLFKVTKAK